MPSEIKKGIGIGIALGFFVAPYLYKIPLINTFVALIIALVAIYFLFFAK